MKQIEEITESDLLELWPAIGGAPHLFEYGKDDLKKTLITGETVDDNDEPNGLQLDYYTMAAIVDILRKNGYQTTPTPSNPTQEGEVEEKDLLVRDKNYGTEDKSLIEHPCDAQLRGMKKENEQLSEMIDAEHEMNEGLMKENEKLKELNAELLKMLVKLKKAASKINVRLGKDDESNHLDNTLCEAIDVIEKANELNQNKQYPDKCPKCGSSHISEVNDEWSMCGMCEHEFVSHLNQSK